MPGIMEAGFIRHPIILLGVARVLVLMEYLQHLGVQMVVMEARVFK
jgi:hypothetical protein